MRLEELNLDHPGDDFTVRFHPTLTVVAGLGSVERNALAAAVVGALAGSAEGVELRWVDHAGLRLTASALDGTTRIVDDAGIPGEALVPAVAGDVDQLRRLLVVRPDDVGLNGPVSAKDLTAARAELQSATARLQRALTAQQTLGAVEMEAGRIDDQIADAEDLHARRTYLRILARLAAVREEAAAVAGGEDAARLDEELVVAAAEAVELADAFHRAADEVGHARTELTEPVDDATAADVPTAVPVDLPALVAAVDRAAERLAAAQQTARDAADASLPEAPSPEVGRLARLDQSRLWDTLAHVEEADADVRRQELALGGIGGAPSRTIDDIESAHREAEEIDRRRSRLRLPGALGTSAGLAASVALVGAAPPVGLAVLGGSLALGNATLTLPSLRSRRAQAKEQALLAEVDAPSYLAFHMRRMEASIDPTIADALAAARVRQRDARTAWDQLADGIEPATARALANDVRRFAEQLTDPRRGEALAAANAVIDERLAPAHARAREELAVALSPFGVDVDHPDPVAGAGAAAVAAARRAIGISVRDLEDRAEAALEAATDALDRIGVPAGDLDDRLAALEETADDALTRIERRAAARDEAEVLGELQELEAEAAERRRPQWADLTLDDLDAVATADDLEVLRRTRDELTRRAAEIREVGRSLAQVVEQHEAARRRLATLEERAAEDHQPAAVVEALASRLAAAASAGDGAGLPCVLDGAVRGLDAATLDRLLLGRDGHPQLIVLADDPALVAWARERAADGALRLLEPVSA